MELKEFSLSTNRINALEKKGITSVEDIVRFFPTKYYDFSYASPLTEAINGKYVAISGRIVSISTKKTNDVLMVLAKVIDAFTEKRLNIMWIGCYSIYHKIKEWNGYDCICCGKLEYNDMYKSYHMNNPVIFDTDIISNLSIFPVYKKMSGISSEFMDEQIKKALKIRFTDTLPEEIRNKYKLMEVNEALNMMHHPTTMQALTNAQKRFTYEKLFQFALEVEKKEHSVSKGTQYNIKSLKGVNKYIDSLPYSLTLSQQEVYDDMKEKAINGLRINALVQGDVGSGKTTSAFLMMVAMADSGYQSILMAPTQILAKQHYEKLKESSEKLGYTTVFLAGKMSATEKKKTISLISSGEADFIIGTQSVLNTNIEYKNLALAVIDEEHKFGVMQRKVLTDKAAQGVHCISMSGTPIPRTMASILYGSNTQVYDLQVPAGRKPIQTAIFNNFQKICDFICKKINEGQQAYVVCPWVDETEESVEIDTVESTKKMYEDYFKEYSDISIASVTGKMDDIEANNILNEFSAGRIDILVCTTVIEVGVNVPNANVIVIHNAERYGLAQLHQLRGRVGRSDQQGYCILKSSDKQNERLNIIVKTTDGLEVAQEDMKLRGSGNILGYEQSGKNEIIDLISKYPNMYRKAQEDARDVVLDTN